MLPAAADQKDKFDASYAAYQRYIKANEPELAMAAAKDAYRYGSSVFGRKHVNTVNLAVNYARLLNDSGDFKAARKALKGKLKVLEKLFGKDAIELIPLVMEVGRAADDPEKALRHFERTAQLSKGYSDDLIEGQKNFDIVINLLRQRGDAHTEPFVDRAYTIFYQNLQPHDFRLGLMSYHKSRWATTRDDPAATLKYLNGALAAFASEDDTLMGELERNVRQQLVATYEQLGRQDAATEHCLALGKKQEWPARPRPLYQPQPEIPEQAFENRLEGEVQMSFTVDAQGFVVNPRISLSNQEVFNEAALALASGFRYAPRFLDGKPVDTVGVEYTMRFSFAEDQYLEARRNFKRPPTRDFMSVDMFDISGCNDADRDERQCEGIGPKR